MGYTCILEERSHDGELVTITLNRPKKLNAMTVELMNELYECLMKIESDAKVRVVILKGNGRGFCAGADLLANALGIGGTKWDSTRINNQEVFSRVIEKIARIPQLVIAAVHGPASGGGMALALAADIRIAGESMKMDAAFIRIGLSGCELGTSYHLPRMVGMSNAMEILCTGDQVTADRALKMGLVSRVVPDDKLYEAAKDMAGSCLKHSWLGLRMTKKGLRSAMDGLPLEAAIQNENTIQVLCLNDNETREYTKAITKKYLPANPKL